MDTPPPAPAAKLLFWGMRALYIGPAFGLSAHRNAVAVLCAGVGGAFEVARDPRDARAGHVACRTALIPANTLHQLVIRDTPMAFLYLDPRSADLAVLKTAMREDHGRFASGLARESEVLEVLQALAGGKGEPAKGKLALDQVLGLPAPASRDERILAALRRLRETPGAAHSLEELAAHSALSPSRFLHLFKQVTGVPLRRYRIWNRMGAAVRRMGAGASLTDAALDAGFSSSAHFSAAFREMFGMAPSRLALAGPAIKLASS